LAREGEAGLIQSICMVEYQEELGRKAEKKKKKKEEEEEKIGGTRD
jgi:hypothetical protein